MCSQFHLTKKKETGLQLRNLRRTTTLSIYKIWINQQVYSARLMQSTTQKRCVSYTKWQQESKSTLWNKMHMKALIYAKHKKMEQYVVIMLQSIASTISYSFALGTMTRFTILCKKGSSGITSECWKRTNQVTLDFVMNIRRCTSSTQTRIRRHIVVSASWSMSRVVVIKTIRYP